MRRNFGLSLILGLEDAAVYRTADLPMTRASATAQFRCAAALKDRRRPGSLDLCRKAPSCDDDRTMTRHPDAKAAA